MLRGTKKQIIHLKNPENPLFEEAFLIVKNHPPKEGAPRSMVEEANRLLAVQDKQVYSMPAQRKRHLPWLALLCFMSGAVTGVLILLLCLL